MSELQKALDIFSASNFQTFPLYSIEGGKCTCGDNNCRSPGKHPKMKDGFKSAKIHTSANDFNGSNVGLYCGESLIVLDADKKNGGLETLKGLKAKHGEDFKTVMAFTGGGGFHIFYRTDRPLKTRTGILKGIDIRANGGYVVMAPSLHISGQRYSWVAKCEPWSIPMLRAPDWLVELSESEKPISPTSPAKQPIRKGQGYLDGSVDWFAVSEALSRLGNRAHNYEDWLEIGMCLHSTGDNHGLEVWDQWSQQSNKYQSGVCAKKWSSFKSEGRTLGTLFHHAGISVSRRENKRQVVQSPKKPNSKPDEKVGGTPKFVYPNGLLWELATEIQNIAQTPFDHWAIAAATSIISALVQGLYVTPTYSKLASYIIIVGSSSAGKNDYVKLAQQIVKELRPLSLKSPPASSQGLMRILNPNQNGHPFIYACRDEIIISHLNIIMGASSSIVQSLVGDYCSVWGDAMLVGQSNKKESESHEAIENPHVTIFGNGTITGLRKLMVNDIFQESGLLSRFDIILSAKEFLNPSLDIPHRKLPDELIKRLKVNLGLPHDYVEGLFVKREPQPLEWESDAVKEQWNNWRVKIAQTAHKMEVKECENPYEYLTMGRLGEKAIRYASIHALGCGRKKVTDEDLKFGVSFVGKARDELIDYLKNYGAENPREEFRKKFLRFLMRHPQGITYGDISKHFHRYSKKAIRNEVIEDLASSGDIVELEIKQAKAKSKALRKLFLASALKAS